MNLDEKARRIQELRRQIKAWEIELEELRSSLMQEMDVIADPSPETHIFPQASFKNDEEVLAYVMHNMPGMVLLEHEYNEDGWKIVVRPERRYVPVSLKFDDIVVNRTISQPTPTIDLERLDRVDPIMASSISKKKTVLEIDEDALKDWIERFPTDIYKLQRALKGKKPSAVIRISDRKEEE